MSKPRIAIIIGSTRPNRKGAGIAAWAHQIAVARTDAEFTVIDVGEFDLPLFNEPMPPSRRTEMAPTVQAWSDAIAPHDGYLFVTAEYNHSVPAALKNAIDMLFAEWADKAAGFVSYGVAGGVRAVEHLRLVLASLRVATVSATTSLGLFTDFDDKGQPHSQHEAALHATLDQLVSWSHALAVERIAAASISV